MTTLGRAGAAPAHQRTRAGTSDIQLLRLGEVALGLSKEQWSPAQAAQETPLHTKHEAT
jgi:hypothetical protein